MLTTLSTVAQCILLCSGGGERADWEEGENGLRGGGAGGGCIDGARGGQHCTAVNAFRHGWTLATYTRTTVVAAQHLERKVHTWNYCTSTRRESDYSIDL